jgi:hypothetical protein
MSCKVGDFIICLEDFYLTQKVLSKDKRYKIIDTDVENEFFSVITDDGFPWVFYSHAEGVNFSFTSKYILTDFL